MNNYPNQPPMQGPPNGYPSNPGYPQYPGQPQFTPQPVYPPQGYQQPPMPPVQPQQAPIPPKKKNKALWIILGLVVAVVACGVIANAGKSSSTTPTAETTTTSSVNTTNSQPAPTQPPAKPQTWQTTHTYTGNGSKKTETFAVGDNWKIQWSCTPGSFDGIDYNVIVSVYNSDGSSLDLSAINSTCKTGNASGETAEHTGGSVYLDITSEGDWSFVIQELK